MGETLIVGLRELEATPERPIVIHPDAREIIADHMDHPAQYEVLEEWLRDKQKVNADMKKYKEALEKHAGQEVESAHKKYIECLKADDKYDGFCAGLFHVTG